MHHYKEREREKERVKRKDLKRNKKKVGEKKVKSSGSVSCTYHIISHNI